MTHHPTSTITHAIRPLLDPRDRPTDARVALRQAFATIKARPNYDDSELVAMIGGALQKRADRLPYPPADANERAGTVAQTLVSYFRDECSGSTAKLPSAAKLLEDAVAWLIWEPTDA